MSLFRNSIRLLSNNFTKTKELNLNVIKQKNNEFIIKSIAAATATTTTTSSLILPISSLSGLTQLRNYSSLQNKAIVVKKMSDGNYENIRYISTQEITRNIFLCTDAPINTDRDPTTLRLHRPINKPLVVLLSWLLSKQKHLSKYAELYVDQGFDVLTVTATPWQLLWPTKGTQLVAADVVKFLENNESYSPLLLHGFSVGAYLWGECMVHMSRDTERYKIILNRICGQIWDSAADITEIPVGVPKAMFPKNETIQKYLRNYMIYHLRTFHEQATSHYIRSSQMFHSTMVKEPALFLLSETDPVGSKASNERVRDSWESMNISCTWKCWKKSPHVGHYLKHKDEYIEYLFNHLQLLNLIRNPEKLKAKL